MAKNITINIGGTEQNFQGIDITRFAQVGTGENADYIDRSIYESIDFDEQGDFPASQKATAIWANDKFTSKFIGTEGNVVVFGKDGTIKDGGTVPIVPYIFTFDETGEYDEENSANIERIKADIQSGKNVCAYIKDVDVLYPASVDLYSYNLILIRAFYYNGSSYYEIKQLSSRMIYSVVDTYSLTFSESEIIPATQKATAEWVKEYVAEQLLIDTEVVL